MPCGSEWLAQSALGPHWHPGEVFVARPPPWRPFSLPREGKEPKWGLSGTDGSRLHHGRMCRLDMCIISRLKTIRVQQIQEELFTSPLNYLKEVAQPTTLAAPGGKLFPEITFYIRKTYLHDQANIYRIFVFLVFLRNVFLLSPKPRVLTLFSLAW